MQFCLRRLSGEGGRGGETRVEKTVREDSSVNVTLVLPKASTHIIKPRLIEGYSYNPIIRLLKYIYITKKTHKKDTNK